MNTTAIALGAIAGVTIYLGLPIAFLRNLSQRTQGFLTAMSTGILVFLLVEITATAEIPRDRFTRPTERSGA